MNVREEGQAVPNQRWRVEEEDPHNAEVVEEVAEGRRAAPAAAKGKIHSAGGARAEPNCSDAGALLS